LAKKLGDKLIVIVNNSEQTKAKKGFEFMPHDERMKIVAALKCVDEVFGAIDKVSERIGACESLAEIKPNIFAKGGNRNVGNIPEREMRISVCESLAEIKPNIFAKGGNRNVGNIPEREICEKYNIKIIDGLGEKIQASSELIKNAKGNGI